VQSALLLLAARIAVAVAAPGGGDCILVFVPGMAEIEKMVRYARSRTYTRARTRTPDAALALPTGYRWKRSSR
jgi:HrpA-like RNA helicase